jgi:hypothetical protein
VIYFFSSVSRYRSFCSAIFLGRRRNLGTPQSISQMATSSTAVCSERNLLKLSN